MNKKVMKLASSGKRLGAYCIDKVVPFIMVCIILVALASATAFTGLNGFNNYGFGYGLGGNGLTVIRTAFSFLIVVVLFVAYIVVQIYFYTKSKTIGKAIMGLQVISSIDGQPVGVLKMLIREWFAKKASAAIFMLGYLWILIDDKNRGWHDKIMDTYVIDLAETAKYNTDNNEHDIQEVDDNNPEGGESIG